MKRSTRLALAMAAVALASAYLVFYQSAPDTTPAPTQKSATTAQSHASGMSDAGPSPHSQTLSEARAPTRTDQPSRTATRVMPRHPAHDNIHMDDPLRIPGSQEEIAWFEANGYPSHEALAEASKSFGEAAHFDASTPLTALNIARAELYARTFPGEATASIAFLERAAASG